MDYWSNGHRKIFLFIGLALFIAGLLCRAFWEPIYNNIVDQQMILRPDSIFYDKWKNPPMSLNFDIYLYNWTNPEDFKNLSTKPILKQSGPYRFVEKPDKLDINWHVDNSSVSYRTRSYYYFDAIYSKGSLEDEITTLNVVALTAANKAKEWNIYSQNIVNIGLTLNSQEMSVKKTADEWLFKGYSDVMIDVGRQVISLSKDEEMPMDRFGFFYKRNGSSLHRGLFNVYTGMQNKNKLGQMHTWNHKKHNGFFEGQCGDIKRSAGEFRPRNLANKETMDIFVPEMCRTLTLDYAGTEEIEGILGHKYVGALRSIDNGTLYPENRCFCGGNCVPSGLMNVSSCAFGSPSFISYPHFYNADPSILQQLKGLKPTKKDHEFYIIVEPRTGTVIEVSVRIQINMLVQPIRGFRLYEGIPKMFFPILWFEQKWRITSELVDEFPKSYIILLAGQIIAGVLFAIGLILLGWYPITEFFCTSKKTKVKISSLASERELKPLNTNASGK